MKLLTGLLAALMFLTVACEDDSGETDVVDPPVVSPGTTASPSGPALEGPGEGAAAVCSAAELEPEAPAIQGLPADVDAVRDEIIEAASQCEYELLAEIALEPDGAFQYGTDEESAGPEAQPGEYWRSQEEAGERPLANLVAVLNTDPEEQPSIEREGPGTGTADSYFVWSSQVDGSTYETAITSQGDWIYYLQDQ